MAGKMCKVASRHGCANGAACEVTNAASTASARCRMVSVRPAFCVLRAAYRQQCAYGAVTIPRQTRRREGRPNNGSRLFHYVSVVGRHGTFLPFRLERPGKLLRTTGTARRTRCP